MRPTTLKGVHMRMYNPSHSGKILAACFDETFTVAAAARQIDVPVSVLTDIIDGKAPVTPELALLFSTIFPGDTPELWLGMQADYDVWQATHNREWQAQVLARHQLSPDLLEGLGPWQ